MPNQEIESICKKFFESLGEKDSRRFAGVLALLFNNILILKILEITEKTLRRGVSELKEDSLPCEGRQRKKGGGRKAKWNDSEMNKAFNEVIHPFIAGDPINPKVKWTNLSRAEIAELLSDKGFQISRTTVRKLLKHNGFKKRKIQKRKSLKVVVDRDAQFNEINKAREEFTISGNPVVSIDTKKKEKIGENVREGHCYANGQIDGPDHDFATLDIGKAVPHGIYDINENHAYINIGKGAETAPFLIDSILLWWKNYGSKLYAHATKILMLFDAGGANSYRHHLFKAELQRLADGMGIEVYIKHYPSYASKWNPIEHRVFPHITRAISGVFIRSYEEFKKLVSRAKTKTGLKITVNDIDGEYEAGARGKKEDWEGSVKFGSTLPKWNYSCTPVF